MLTVICIGWIIVVVIFLSVLVMRFYPPIGGYPSKEKQNKLKQSSQFLNGKFVNQIPTSTNVGIVDRITFLMKSIKGRPNKRPRAPLPSKALDPLLFESDHKQAKFVWFGHSVAMVEVDGKILLLDPMLGSSPSLVPLLGHKRYPLTHPVKIDHLPAIDAVLLSHDHYDHLDYGSIKKLNKKVKHFYVPLGVGTRLETWGIEPSRITELDWWDKVACEGFTLISTPARHYSGRSPLDHGTTLWCSWVIDGGDTKVFFSGDSGYGPHFQEIGNKYGPFDLTLMECGQYNELWEQTHMKPEQSVQAHLDVKGNVLIPIHWAAFTLALHSWTDPVERAVKSAEESGVNISTPQIGETVVIGAANYPVSKWWREV